MILTSFPRFKAISLIILLIGLFACSGNQTSNTSRYADAAAQVTRNDNIPSANELPNDGSRRKLSLTTIARPGSFESNIFVIQGSNRSYFFSPGRVATATGPLTLVRDYNALWVFRTSDVKARILSDSKPFDLKNLQVEPDAKLAAAIFSSLHNRPTLQNDPCPDCVLPVSYGFPNDPRFFSPPVPKLVPTANNSASMSCKTNCMMRVLSSGGPKVTGEPAFFKPSTEYNASCFPSEYRLIVSQGICVTSISPTNSPTRRHVDAAFGYSYDYFWRIFSAFTELRTSVPWLYANVTWVGDYVDVIGDYAEGGGVFFALGGSFDLGVTPTITPFSYTVVSLLNNTNLQEVGGFGIDARWTF